MKIKIRGIYTTALTYLLKEAGFEIVNPSQTINERININNNDSADVLIYDKEDLNGVTINGNGAEAVVEKLRKLPDAIIKKLESGAIYLGKIKKVLGNQSIVVDLGNNEEGILSLHNYWGFIREGEKVLVQVKGIIGKNKILSTKLRLFGNSAILIKDGFGKVSKHITSQKEISRLKELEKKCSIKGWGVLWKSLAEGKTDSELIQELNELIAEEQKLKELFEKTETPCLLKEGSCNYFVDFGASSKQKLDKLRQQVTTTVVGHHFLKSGGYSLLADFAESLEGLDNDFVLRKINSVLRNEGPKEKQYYEIHHKKPDGRKIIMKGIVEKATENEVVIKRKLFSGKRFDGLGGVIEDGDYAITKMVPNGWTVTHYYFSKEGAPKGVYININTPVEVYPKFARYLDLEVDVIEKDNKKEIVDAEKLKKVVDKNIISKELANEAIKIANQILTGEKNG